MGRDHLAAPCGLYCGVCAIYIAHREDNLKLKLKLANVYKVGYEDIRCEGCLSDELFVYCGTCPIRSCALDNGIEGCHQCDEFPCEHVDQLPFSAARRVVVRSVPVRRDLGTERWMDEEEMRYRCPRCGAALFRYAQRCRNCREPVDLE